MMIMSLIGSDAAANYLIVGMVSVFVGWVSLNCFMAFRNLESRIEALERNRAERESTH